MSLPAGESRSVHDVRTPVENRLEQTRVVARVIFQIGVLNQHDIAGRALEALAQSGTLALVDRLEMHDDVLVRPSVLDLGIELERTVGRTVVHKDDLSIQTGIDGEHLREQLLERSDLVVDRNDDG